MSNRELTRFLVITFLLGFSFQSLAIHQAVLADGRAWLMATNWAPGIAALTTSAKTRARAWAAVRHLGIGTLGFALVTGWAIWTIRSLALAVSGLGTWNADVFRLADQPKGVEGVRGLDMVLGSGPQSWELFGVNFVMTLILGSVILGGIFAVGEELGWRVVLQPELEERLGTIRGTSAVGLIWGYWHLPLNLAGYQDPLHPWVTALVLFQLTTTIPLALGLAWLFNRSGSVWPPALAHGAFNCIVGMSPISSPDWRNGLCASLFGGVLFAAVFGWLLLGARSPTSRWS